MMGQPSTEVDFYREELRGCGELDAKKAFALMLGEYAQQRLNSPQGWQRKFVTLFQRYPKDVVGQVVDDHSENHDWLKVSEVRAHLDECARPRRQKLREAREREALAELDFHESPEQEAEVRSLLAGLAISLRVSHKAPKPMAFKADRDYDEGRKENAAPKDDEFSKAGLTGTER